VFLDLHSQRIANDLVESNVNISRGPIGITHTSGNDPHFMAIDGKRDRNVSSFCELPLVGDRSHCNVLASAIQRAASGTYHTDTVGCVSG
jgi:hypothetical protein